MQLLVNERDEIIAYSIVGDIGGINYEGETPDNFYYDFKPTFFLFKNAKIYGNPNYAEPVPNLPTGPTSLEQVVMQQAMTIAQIQQMLLQQNKDIAKLKGVNA